jgi:hypothetical protein
VGLFVALRRPAPLHGRPTLTAPELGAAGGKDSAGGASSAHAPARASKAHRLADGVALSVLLAGVAIFLYARHRLQLLAADRIDRVEGHWAVEQFSHWRHVADAGLWTAGAGLALAIGLAIWQWRRNSSRAIR